VGETVESGRPGSSEAKKNCLDLGKELVGALCTRTSKIPDYRGPASMGEKRNHPYPIPGTNLFRPEVFLQSLEQTESGGNLILLSPEDEAHSFIIPAVAHDEF
jgi:hypothetical protein